MLFFDVGSTELGSAEQSRLRPLIASRSCAETEFVAGFAGSPQESLRKPLDGNRGVLTTTGDLSCRGVFSCLLSLWCSVVEACGGAVQTLFWCITCTEVRVQYLSTIRIAPFLLGCASWVARMFT